ncbi:MAG: hypothetical protein SGJ11_04050 [Phycisphaerae bacterium]|nr:hypothetical protein [Phycisphaerae bacterium]
MRSRPTAEEVAGPEWAAWYALTPMQRWEAGQRLFAEYVAMGGSLEPEIDTQSPFWSDEDFASFARAIPVHRASRAEPGGAEQP